MFIVNSLKILVPTCYSPNAKVQAYLVCVRARIRKGMVLIVINRALSM